MRPTAAITSTCAAWGSGSWSCSHWACWPIPSTAGAWPPSTTPRTSTRRSSAGSSRTCRRRSPAKRPEPPAPAAPTRAEGPWSRAGEGGAASALSERRPPVFEGRGQRALEGLDGGGDVGVGMGGGDVPATTGQGEDAAAQQLDQQPVVEGLVGGQEIFEVAGARDTDDALDHRPHLVDRRRHVLGGQSPGEAGSEVAAVTLEALIDPGLIERFQGGLGGREHDRVAVVGAGVHDSGGGRIQQLGRARDRRERIPAGDGDRKSTRPNSSHVAIAYAVFCL